jgi:hypothetical protein
VKKTAFLAGFVMLIVATMPAVAATSVANLKGTYNFYVLNVKAQTTGQCIAQPNGTCAQINYVESITQQVSAGTIYFDGTGKVVEFTSFGQSGGNGGPVLNKNYGPYKVSGFNASFTLTGIVNGGKTCGAVSNPCPVVTLSMGSFINNVASTALILINNTGGSGPLVGAANLQ